MMAIEASNSEINASINSVSFSISNPKPYSGFRPSKNWKELLRISEEALFIRGKLVKKNKDLWHKLTKYGLSYINMSYSKIIIGGPRLTEKDIEENNNLFSISDHGFFINNREIKESEFYDFLSKYLEI